MVISLLLFCLEVYPNSIKARWSIKIITDMSLESIESSLTYPLFSPVGTFKSWFTSLGSALITGWVVISIGACKTIEKSIKLMIF